MWSVPFAPLCASCLQSAERGSQSQADSTVILCMYECACDSVCACLCVYVCVPQRQTERKGGRGGRLLCSHGNKPVSPAPPCGLSAMFGQLSAVVI